MKILRLFVLLCLICTSSAVALAADETIDLGPVTISLDLESGGPHTAEKGETSTMDHEKPRFQYEIGSTNINFDGTQDKVQLEVHQMSMSAPLDQAISKRDQVSGLEHCIMQSNIMPVGQDMQTEPYTIGGLLGILATINNYSENPLYIVAYSPDQKDGSGSIVCVVSSDFSWEITKSIFDSVKTQVV
ncbi:Uncharacterised protein [uncultured archaeon]|nr:Uncharacterised protein [uncultured archaeon]